MALRKPSRLFAFTMKEDKMDKIDDKILAYLQENSRLSHKEIGQRVHMTGQAVGMRINRMLETGMIENYTISIKYAQQQFIRIFMDNNQYDTFEKSVNNFPEIISFYKVSGQACYMIVSHFDSERLTHFISVISKWGRYSVENVIADKKTVRDKSPL